MPACICAFLRIQQYRWQPPPRPGACSLDCHEASKPWLTQIFAANRVLSTTNRSKGDKPWRIAYLILGSLMSCGLLARHEREHEARPCDPYHTLSPWRPGYVAARRDLFGQSKQNERKPMQNERKPVASGPAPP